MRFGALPFRLFALGSSIVAVCATEGFTAAQAQNMQGLEGIFGGIVGAAIEQQNRAEWQRLRTGERMCIVRGLRREGSDLAQVMRDGMSPADPRIAPIRATCQSVIDKKLQRNVDCTINTTAGVFTSKCDEDYASANDTKSRISQADALDQAFSDQGVTTALFERTDALNRRGQMISNGSSGGPVVAPNFDCGKAQLETEIAICNSAALSALDAEYGELFRRYRPSGRQNPVAKEAAASFKRRGECGSSDDCLKRNLESSIAFVARALRKRGDKVETSIERVQRLAAAEQARVDEQKRVEQREVQAAEERTAASLRQAEADRRAEAERLEADRKAAEEKARADAERAARLAQVSMATNDLVKTASDFLKYDKSNPRLLAIAEAIALATSSLDTKDPDKVDAAKQNLDNVIRDDPKFASFQQAAADTQSKENARLLADALLQVRKQKRFLESYIAENPTSAAAKSAIGFVKAGDDVLASTDLKKLRTYIGSVQDLLRQYDLQQNFLLSLNAVDDGRAEQAAAAEAGLGRTAKNRFLMDGTPDDLVLMYVSAPTAPDVVRNLRGEIVFDHSKAVACIYQATSSVLLRDRIVKALKSKYDIHELLIQAQPCAKDGLLSNDVVAVQRGEFLKQELSYAAAITKEIENDHVKPLLSITGDQISTALQSIAAKRKQIEADIDHGALDGFGLVILPAYPSQAVCGAVPPDDLDAHQALFMRFEDPRIARLRQRLDLQKATVEDVFKDVQRSHCSAVYASAADLKLLLDALRREQVTYEIFEETISTDQIKGERSKIETGLKADEKANLDRQKQADDARSLRALRERDLAASKAVQQAALRAKYGQLAMSNAADISNEIKGFLESRGAPGADSPGRFVAASFPAIADWYRSALQDHWELQSVDAGLDDFGSVDWKGRPLAAVFSVIHVRLKNATIGEYRDGCFKAGQVIDHEFKVTRDAIDAACDDGGTIASWNTAHTFKSVWKLE